MIASEVAAFTVHEVPSGTVCINQRLLLPKFETVGAKTRCSQNSTCVLFASNMPLCEVRLQRKGLLVHGRWP
jgi:hypothetical protein